MLRPYNLLEEILIEIENNLNENINIDTLAEKFSLSERHLRRIFNFAFKQTLGDYIRSRKLSASLIDLKKDNANILNIALDYGFDYEQNYIRSFKQEFGITPNDFRRTGNITKEKQPFHLFGENKLSNGNLIFSPDIVMVPQFHVIGKNSRSSFDYIINQAPDAGKQFLFNERKLIKNIINPNIYFGIGKVDIENKYFNYMPSVQVDNLDYVPQGFDQYTFNSSLCAKFRYIGKHHYFAFYTNYDLVNEIINEMYKAVLDNNGENGKYTMSYNKVFFEKINLDDNDGTYCQMEWFTPVEEK
ncbi:MAG: helix-turn-helix domain-containing protein [Treponema sp.]|nr:helix-turn-helix domain-containing protein [Treponema sp.]